MKRVHCTACEHVPAHEKHAPNRIKCHECHDVGFIEYNDKGCTHLPPLNIEYEAMVGGWMCPCGASGPWNKQYEKDYNQALKAVRKGAQHGTQTHQGQ